MSNPPTICANPCETCEKKGLPLLLTRYAVLTEESKAPALSGQLGGGALKAITLGGNANYGLRLLRSGYVYVHDEARKHWDEYFVTADGFLTKLPPRLSCMKDPRPAPPNVFACARSGAAPLAGVITIRNPKHASNIWIGFSDVEWTDDTLQKHEDAAYRARHMQKIVISGGKVSPQAHTAPLEQVDAVVPEFKLDPGTVKKHIAPWALFQYNARTEQAKSFKEAVQKARPEGGAAIVALFDPAGVTAELDALMNYNLNTFIGDSKRQRPLAVSQVVMQLEEAVRAQAVEQEEAAAEDLANQQLSQPDIGMLFSSGYRDKKLKQIEDIRTVTPAEAKRAQEQAWAKYTAKFNEPALKSWRAQHDEELKAHDAKTISPLAIAHRDWMKCKVMGAYFECNFDDTDLDSGHAYAMTVSMCLGSTQDKAACFDLYTDWLSADTFEKNNLLLNALVLNLKATKDEIKKAMAQSLDWRGFPLDGLTGSFGESIKLKWEAMADAIGNKIVARQLGPLAKVIDRAVDGKVKPSLVALSLYTGKTYTVVDLVGGKKAFRALLIKQLIKLSKQPLNQRQMERAVAAEMRRLEIAGVKLDGTQKKRFLIIVDEEQFKAMPKNLDAASRARWLAGSLTKVEDIQALEFGHWQAKLGQPSTSWIKGSQPYIFGLMAALFQYHAMNKLGEDKEKAMSHETVETKYRLDAGMVAFWGTLADLTGQGMEKIVSVVPKLAPQLRFVSALLKFGGRGAGIVGAGIVAWWDGRAGMKAREEKNYGMAALYFTSAGLGLGAATLLLLTGMFAWAGPLALVLIALLIGVAVLIEMFKDNKVQEWLKRCWWGNGPDAKYRDVETEMAELKQALA